MSVRLLQTRLSCAGALLFTSLALFASPSQAWDQQQAETALQQVIEQVRDHYVIEADRGALVSALEQAWQKQQLDLANPTAFASDLTTVLRSVNGDGHLSLNYSPANNSALHAGQDDDAESAQSPEEALAYWTEQGRVVNWGFGRLEWLPGRIGYLDLTGFWDLGDSYTVADAAMRFLAASDAVIIDLRHNGGGSAAMVQYLISYFIDDGRELVRFYDGYTGQTRHQYALNHVNAPRLTDKPLYVLIGGRTGSAAEEFASHVGLFELGELVGEATYGAAHNNTFLPIDPGFTLSLSFGMPIHPVSGGNWEGKGVPPSVPIAAEDALEKARELALEQLIQQGMQAGKDDQQLQTYRWALEQVRALQKEYVHSAKELNAMAGSYAGERRVELRGDRLYLKRGRRPAQALLALEHGLFAPLDGAAERMRFVGKAGAYQSLEWNTGAADWTRFERMDDESSDSGTSRELI